MRHQPTGSSPKRCGATCWQPLQHLLMDVGRMIPGYSSTVGPTVGAGCGEGSRMWKTLCQHQSGKFASHRLHSRTTPLAVQKEYSLKIPHRVSYLLHETKRKRKKKKKEKKKKREKKKNSWSTPLVAPTPSCPCPCPCPSSPSPRPPCPRPPPRRRPRPRPCHPRPPRPPRLQSRSYCPPSFPSSPWSS